MFTVSEVLALPVSLNTFLTEATICLCYVTETKMSHKDIY